MRRVVIGVLASLAVLSVILMWLWSTFDHSKAGQVIEESPVLIETTVSGGWPADPGVIYGLGTTLHLDGTMRRKMSDGSVRILKHFSKARMSAIQEDIDMVKESDLGAPKLEKFCDSSVDGTDIIVEIYRDSNILRVSSCDVKLNYQNTLIDLMTL